MGSHLGRILARLHGSTCLCFDFGPESRMPPDSDATSQSPERMLFCKQCE